MDVSGPICISPIGFGFALFGLLVIFLIALSTAIKYASAPANGSKYDEQTIISAEYSVHTLPHHVSRYGQERCLYEP